MIHFYFVFCQMGNGKCCKKNMEEQSLTEKKKKGEIGIKDYLQGKKEIKAEKDKIVVEYGVKLS